MIALCARARVAQFSSCDESGIEASVVWSSPVEKCVCGSGWASVSAMDYVVVGLEDILYVD